MEELRVSLGCILQVKLSEGIVTNSGRLNGSALGRLCLVSHQIFCLVQVGTKKDLS